MSKLIIIAISAIIILFLAVSVHASSVCACAPIVPTPVCLEGEHVGNPHCDEVTPSTVPTVFVEATQAPTASPEATVEVTQAVTPTEQPQSPHGDGLSDGRESGHINAPSIPNGAPKTGKGA